MSFPLPISDSCVRAPSRPPGRPPAGTARQCRRVAPDGSSTAPPAHPALPGGAAVLASAGLQTGHQDAPLAGTLRECPAIQCPPTHWVATSSPAPPCAARLPGHRHPGPLPGPRLPGPAAGALHLDLFIGASPPKEWFSTGRPRRGCPAAVLRPTAERPPAAAACCAQSHLLTQLRSNLNKCPASLCSGPAS